MPLLPDHRAPVSVASIAPIPVRRQSQHSIIAKSAIMTSMNTHILESQSGADKAPGSGQHSTRTAARHSISEENAIERDTLKPIPSNHRAIIKENLGSALTDTPRTTPGPSTPSTAPGSPRVRPTTLDIPGLTRSKASPDGRISQRDVGAKLVIVMVGLPARGKSYVTKKIARYLNWLQHDTRIFNVGERRRVAAGSSTFATPLAPHHVDGKDYLSSFPSSKPDTLTTEQQRTIDQTNLAARILINGSDRPDLPPLRLPSALLGNEFVSENMEQSAEFFDPSNTRAALLREQVALETLDELLDFILDRGGSVGILDATNSTLERRKAVVRRIRERAGPELGILFLESLCVDEQLLESNMRLKLSGPDYKDQDPTIALEDFRKRVALYEKKYVPLGEYEEKHNMQFVQMIDVGRKIVSHQIRGFLACQTVFYLLNFNLSPRQIWITRHGESVDNVHGKIGGDSHLSEKGRNYAKALTKFLTEQRKKWTIRQQDKVLSTHFPPLPGDTTPPNPEYGLTADSIQEKNFCVWTSMLRRSIETAQYFDEEDYDIKQMRMLDELNSGSMEGMTYEEIREKFPSEYELRKQDKLHYRYPGAGGEGYLDIINRLRTVIVEVERMTDHVLLVGHRSVVRVLLAYFKGLRRDEVADLDAPLGVLYMLEPKPYGVDFKAYRYNEDSQWFDYVPEYELRRALTQTAS